MKTKTIPFDLELAKKIQAGEIQGKIMYNNSEVEILGFDMYVAGDAYLCAKTKGNSGEYRTRLFDKQGKDAGDKYGALYNIYLEVPDDEPQFKVNEEVELYELHGKILCIKDGLIEVDIPPCGSVFVRDTSILKHINRVQEKHEFKPFEQVLVRDNKTQEWVCTMLSHVKTDGDYPIYVSICNYPWLECIPYAGNEHLVGTTDEPK